MKNVKMFACGMMVVGGLIGHVGVYLGWGYVHIALIVIAVGVAIIFIKEG